MTSILQRLIDALRDELQQHGEVLGFLDADPGLTLTTACSSPGATFQSHTESLLALRARRETLQHQLAWACQRPDALAPEDLLPLVSDEIRPLLRALFEENNALRQRIEQRARQDHPWLGGSPLIARLAAGSDTTPTDTPPNLIVLGALSA